MPGQKILVRRYQGVNVKEDWRDVLAELQKYSQRDPVDKESLEGKA